MSSRSTPQVSFTKPDPLGKLYVICAVRHQNGYASVRVSSSTQLLYLPGGPCILAGVAAREFAYTHSLSLDPPTIETAIRRARPASPP